MDTKSSRKACGWLREAAEASPSSPSGIGSPSVLSDEVLSTNARSERPRMPACKTTGSGPAGMPGLRIYGLSCNATGFPNTFRRFILGLESFCSVQILHLHLHARCAAIAVLAFSFRAPCRLLLLGLHGCFLTGFPGACFMACLHV